MVGMPEQELAAKLDIQELKRDINERLDLLQNLFIEALQMMHKEIVRAFNNWVSPIEVKMRGHEERLALLEDRLRQLERALGDPPIKKDVN